MRWPTSVVAEPNGAARILATAPVDARPGHFPPDQPSDALRIRAVHRLGVSPCLTRSAGPPIRVERRQKAKMITDVSQGACTLAQTPWSGAEARGFEPRKGANPNRISSPVSGPESSVSGEKALQSAQVSEGPAYKAAEAGSNPAETACASNVPARRTLAAMTGDRLIRAAALVAVAGHHARSRT